MSRGADERDADSTADGTGSGDSDPAVDSMLRKVAQVSHMSADTSLPRLGQVIGEKYRIEERLGRGGMGVVFRATHLVSRKAVALKWMLRSTADAAAHRRLLREALAAGRIDHPNVVDVYDVGQEADSAYLVMELLHGESLRARLARGRLDSHEAIDLLLPALRGVSAAHRAGVIHRDLKPDNIFLCTGPDGSAREAKVLDFGISAVLVQSTIDPPLTDGATILGTPAYMSPEQLASAQDTDERTDVYAFAVILYEALTGQLPFVADSYSGLVLAVALDPPRPPSEHCAHIPRELERAILLALSKHRQDRPQSVDALRELIAPFGSKPPSSKTEPRRVRIRRDLSWLPVLIACAFALALLLRAAYVFFREEGPAAPVLPTLSASAAPSPPYVQAPPVDSAKPVREEVALPAAEPVRNPTPRATPHTCEEARRAGQIEDGLRSIDPDGLGPQRAFKVYCAGMSGEANTDGAREYLPLIPDSERNSTRFRYGGSACPCPDLVRRFTHVRLDPATLAIDPADGTFATYDRPLSCERLHRHQCGESTNLAWGGAGSCRGAGDTSGSASIDVSGTGFVLAPNLKFVAAGFGASGGAVVSADRRSAKLAGGGLCGSLVPEHGVVRLVMVR